MLNKIKYIDYKKFILIKKKKSIKTKTKINCFLLNKDFFIYNGKSYILRNFNYFFLKKFVNTNILLKKPLAKPMKKKKKK